MARVAVDGGKVSPVMVRALRAYLTAEPGQGDPGREAPADTSAALVPLLAALEQQRQDLARIGGNLNQIAHAFNVKGRLHDEALAVTHGELRASFAALASLVVEVRNEIKKRI